MNRLVQGRFLVRLTAWSSEIPPIESPLHAWNPGDPEPDFDAIAYAAQKRWQNRSVRQRTIFVASNKLLAMFALPPRPHLKAHHVTHDFCVTEMYTYCRQRWPELDFVGEDIFAATRGHGEGVEDAQLVASDQIVAIAEYAGSYRKHRVVHFHQHVAERRLPYFLS